MLKHVQISPLRNRSDSVSLRSSTSCASSMCGSPEPPTELQRTPSRASSFSSLNEQVPQTTIKVYTNCLKNDIEYKTLGIQWDTTSKEVIAQLLRRLKMRHRDPRLFYLSMEVSVRRAGVKTILVMDDDTRPAILQACHPKGESRFCLQLKPGGLIRVHTSALQPTSQYKSLVISEETTSDELLQLLLSCYNSLEPVEQFSIYEVCPGQEYQRKLHPDDIPLRAQAERMKRGETCHFLVRRNPNYARRRQLLSTLNNVVVQTYAPHGVANGALNGVQVDDDGNSSLFDLSINSLAEDLHSLMVSDEDEDCVSSTSGSSDTSSEGSTTVRRTLSNLTIVPMKPTTSMITHQKPQLKSGGNNNSSSTAVICAKCRNNFKSCEFCHKNSSTISNVQRQAGGVVGKAGQGGQLPHTYNPVYNIREIRTVSHSFSSLGNDKKLLDIELNGRFDPSTCRMRPQSVFLARSTRMVMDVAATAAAAAAVTGSSSSSSNSNIAATAINGNRAVAVAHKRNVDYNDNNNNNNNSNINNTTQYNNTSAKTATAAATTTTTTTVAGEAVNNNPAKGLGNFVYL